LEPESIASFDPKLSNKVICDLGNEAPRRFRAYRHGEKDWVCIVEFLPIDNAQARLPAADIIGDLVGYANLTTSTRSLALLADPDTSAYELLFSFLRHCGGGILESGSTSG